jgi:hypothetical protein
MSKRINKELQEAIEKLNQAIKGTKGSTDTPLVFVPNITIKKDGKGQ